MKVRLVVSMESKIGRSGEVSEMFKQWAESWRNNGAEPTVLYRKYGRVNTHYMMCDFESLAALEAIQESSDKTFADRVKSGGPLLSSADSPFVDGSSRHEILQIAE